MPIYSATVKLAETVHGGVLGFTQTLYVFAAGESAAQAEEHVRAWVAACGGPAVTQVKITEAARQRIDRYVYPELIKGAPAHEVEAALMAHYPELYPTPQAAREHMAKCARKPLR